METRRGPIKKKNNKLIGCLGIIIILLIFVIAMPFLFGEKSSKDQSEKQDYSESNTKVIEAKDEKSRASVIAETKIKKIYNIDNFKVNYTDSSFKVFRMPDDKNSETGEVYKNVYSAKGNFTWQDKTYDFYLLYSMSSADNYTVLSLTSNIDNNIKIDVPLESDK